jgi:hypothetical protein
MFWRGTSYIPHWVTENGIWFTNEFNETWGHGIPGCGEPMSDKQCRYSRVSVVESGPARVVIHWRYALTDVYYDIARTDQDTGWGDWTDEVHTVFPDGTALREITLHTSQPEAPHEWHESIVVMGPGVSPTQALQDEALTVWSASGESVSFDWAKGNLPWHPERPTDIMLQRVNTRSQYRPFTAIRPQDGGSMNLFAKEIRPEVSPFPWWNHWPTALNPCDGRYAFAADRPSHSSLNNLHWNPIAEGKDWQRKIMLTGMTDASEEELLQRVRAWAYPADCQLLHMGASGVVAVEWIPEEHAWVFDMPGGNPESVSLKLAGSVDTPIVNPSFIIRNWPAEAAEVTLDGEVIPPGLRCRQQLRIAPEGQDLVLWLELKSTKPHTLSLFPVP